MPARIAIEEEDRVAQLMRRQGVTPDISALQRFKIADTTPFGGNPAETASDLIGQAYALSLVLSNVLHDPERGKSNGAVREFHLSLAIDGLGSLLALAGMHAEVVV